MAIFVNYNMLLLYNSHDRQLFPSLSGLYISRLGKKKVEIFTICTIICAELFTQLRIYAKKTVSDTEEYLLLCEAYIFTRDEEEAKKCVFGMQKKVY